MRGGCPWIQNKLAEKYDKSNMKILLVKPEIRNTNKTNGVYGNSCRCIRHVPASGYKVSHGYLQHHWRHHHRRHHNQHDVPQLFQSNSILRVPTTSLSPRHAMPSFSGRDGLPLEDFRWLQLIAKIIRHLSLFFLFRFVLCLYLLLNDHQW